MSDALRLSFLPTIFSKLQITESTSRLFKHDLSALAQVMIQLRDPYLRQQPFDVKKGLAMIRSHVNSRKHAVYFRDEVLDSIQGAPPGPRRWSSAGSAEQMAIALDSYVLLCAAYHELMAWRPLAAD